MHVITTRCVYDKFALCSPIVSYMHHPRASYYPLQTTFQTHIHITYVCLCSTSSPNYTCVSLQRFVSRPRTLESWTECVRSGTTVLLHILHNTLSWRVPDFFEDWIPCITL